MTDHTQTAAVPFLPIRLENAQTWAAFADTARQVNLKNGWGTTFTLQAVPGYLALVHSEITEAAMANDPLEVAGELADVVIRCADLSELLDPGHFGINIQGALQGDATGMKGLELGVALLSMHSATSSALEVFRKVNPVGHMVDSVLLGVAIVAARAFTVGAMQIEGHTDHDASGAAYYMSTCLWAKLEKNKARGYRHGNLRT